MRVLIIEDNLDIQSNIADFLEPEFVLDFAYNGDDGLNLARTNDYDVIVLDLNLPRRDGIEVCRVYKTEVALQAPILMLTARDTLDDKAEGFAAGADDYLTKPFALRELKMRIEALAKRPRVMNTIKLNYGGLVLEPSSHTLSANSSSQQLNKKETLILTLLLAAAPNPVPSSTISYKIWGEEPPNSGALRTHIYNLRQILADIQSGSDTAVEIETDRSHGYRLNIQEGS